MKTKVAYLAHKNTNDDGEDLARATKPFPFTFMVICVCAVTFLAAVSAPWIVGVSYDSALFAPSGQKLLVPFAGLFLIWTALGLFWQAPPQYVAFPALSFLHLGYAIATCITR